jgi:hypothetical protein
MPDGHRVRVPPERSSPAPAAAASQPQTGPPPGTTTSPSPANKDAAASAAPRPSPAAALPPSLLDKPAQPAEVVLSGGRLAVDANNSSLSQILDALKTTSGMTIDGLGKDQRVFGHYGPGTPRDVLSSLLDGAGYNFMMVGTTDSGTPQEIILTQRSNAPLVADQSPAPDTEDEVQPIVNLPPEPVPPRPRPSSVMPPPGAPDANGRVRTPQEILQELERMRAQQPQQQPQ